ncbi:hypothetical protein [Xenorhabdus hominickii]|uniref:Uncharacterized protein n=1 Tax=Xenorhabdus hominickii TaxID=351679 RepID=A0A2G0QDR5_XENHO|nr:hypothetical protein [Xenorhabdus hominickii]AOM41428.1 hypothetical protein A9255_13055 [Xenorhabdus hominickii]PHM57346.1 hypothetical protein Xhom_00312 [Xenorhabdus hominickii]
MLETFQIWSFKSLCLVIRMDFVFGNTCAASAPLRLASSVSLIGIIHSYRYPKLSKDYVIAIAYTENLMIVCVTYSLSSLLMSLDIETVFKQQGLERMVQKIMIEKKLHLSHNLSSNDVVTFSYFCFSIEEPFFKVFLSILYIFIGFSEYELIARNNDNRSKSFYLRLMCSSIDSQFGYSVIYKRVWKFHKKNSITIVTPIPWILYVACKKFPIVSSFYKDNISSALAISENHRPFMFPMSIHPNPILPLTRFTHNKPVDINIFGDD